MTARASMAGLIRELREMTAAGTADYTVAGQSYFSDDHLQTDLDNTQVLGRLVPLEPIFTPAAGAFQWFDYHIPDGIGPWIEDYTSGTALAGWAVRDGSGNPLGTALYTANLDAQKITFSADQQGQIRYLDCTAYDLNAAAAQVWRRKAALEQKSVDWQSDNHKIAANQRFEHCLKMAEHYERQGAGISQSLLVRTDESREYRHDLPWDVQPDPHRRFNDW